MRTVSFSAARNNLKKVLDQVEDEADVTIVTRRDAGDVVVMSLETFNSWQETVHLLSSPANARRLAESISQLRGGKARPRRLVETGPAPAKKPVRRARAATRVVKKAKKTKQSPRGNG